MLTYTHSGNFTEGTSYMIQVYYTAKSMKGEFLGNTHRSYFTAWMKPDTDPPIVVSTLPSNGATGVPPVQVLEIQWNETMNMTSADAAFTSAPPITCNFTWAPTLQKCNHATPLQTNTTYTVTISTAARDPAGNQMRNPHVFSFTTAPAPDTSPPYVVSTSPANGATGVATSAVIQVTWNESMNQTSAQTAFSATPAIICVWDWPALGVQVCTPSAPLQTSATYSVTISTAAKDFAGNPLPVQHGFGFTTASGPGPAPKVQVTNPADGTIDVPLNALISMTFDVEMDRAATEAAIVGLPGVSGSFAWTPDGRTVTLDPSSDLFPFTDYSVTVGTGARSKAGVSLSAPFRFSFRTGNAADVTPPAILHSPVSESPEQVPIRITAKVTDDTTVVEVWLHHRPQGSVPYRKTVMILSGSDYVSTISGSDVLPPSIEYYIEASDIAGNTAYSPLQGSGAPYVILVRSAGTPPPPQPDPLAGAIPFLVLGIAVAVAGIAAAFLWRRRWRRVKVDTLPPPFFPHGGQPPVAIARSGSPPPPPPPSAPLHRPPAAPPPPPPW